MYGPNGHYPPHYYVPYPPQAPIQSPVQQAQTSAHTDSPHWVVERASIEQSKAIVDILRKLETTTQPKVYHEALAQIFSQGLYRHLSTSGMLCLLKALGSPLAPTTRHSTELYVRLISFLARHGGDYTFSDYSFGMKLAEERVPFCDQDRRALAKALSGVIQNTADRLVIDRPSPGEVLEWLCHMVNVKHCDDPVILSRAVGRAISYLDKDMGMLSKEEILLVLYVGALFHVQGSDWLHVLHQSVDRLLAVGSSLNSNSAVKLLYILTVYECTDPSRIKRVLEDINYSTLNFEGRRLLSQVHFACEDMFLECSGKPLAELVETTLPREGYLPPRELDELVELCNELRLGATKGDVIGPYSVDVSYRDIRIAMIVQTTMERVQPGRCVLRARYLNDQFYRVITVDLDGLRALPPYQWPAWLKEKLDLSPGSIWSTSSSSWLSFSSAIAEQTTVDDEEVAFAHAPGNDVESVDDLCKFWTTYPSKELIKPTVQTLRALIKQPFADVGEEIALLVELVLNFKMQDWQSDLTPVKEMLVAHLIRELDSIKEAGKWNALPERMMRACYREWLMDGNVSQLQQYGGALQQLLGDTMGAEALLAMQASDRLIPDASLVWLLCGESNVQALENVIEQRLMLAVQEGDRQMVDLIFSAASERFQLNASTVSEGIIAMARSSQQNFAAVTALVRYLVPRGKGAAKVDRNKLSHLLNAILSILPIAPESERPALFQAGLILLTAEIERTPSKFSAQTMADRVLALASYGNLEAVSNSSRNSQKVIKVTLSTLERSNSSADWKRWKRLGNALNEPVGQDAILAVAAGWSARGRPDKAFKLLHDAVQGKASLELNARLIQVAEQCLSQCLIGPFRVTLDYFQTCPKHLCERLKQLWVCCLDSAVMRKGHTDTIVQLLIQQHQAVSKLMNSTHAHLVSKGKGPSSSVCTGLLCALIRFCGEIADSHEQVLQILTTYSIRNSTLWKLWWDVIGRSKDCNQQLIERAWDFLYASNGVLEGDDKAKAYNAACKTMYRHSPSFVNSLCQDYSMTSRVLAAIEGAPGAWLGIKILKALCSEGHQLPESVRNSVTVAAVRHCSVCQEGLNGLLEDFDISQLGSLVDAVCESMETVTNYDGRVIAHMLVLRTGQAILIRKLASTDHVGELTHCAKEIVRNLQQSILHSSYIESLDHYMSVVACLVTHPMLPADSRHDLGCALLRIHAIVTRQQSSHIDRLYRLSLYFDALESIAPHISFERYEFLADLPELIIGMSQTHNTVEYSIYTNIVDRFRRFYLRYVLRATQAPSQSDIVTDLSIGCLAALERRWKYILVDDVLCGSYRTLAVMVLRGLIGQAERLREWGISDYAQSLINRCLSLTVHRSCEMAMVALEHESTIGILEDASKLVEQFRQYLPEDSFHEMSQRIKTYIPRELTASSTRSPTIPLSSTSDDRVATSSSNMQDLQRRLGIDQQQTIGSDAQAMEALLCQKVAALIAKLESGDCSPAWMGDLIKSLQPLLQASKQSEALHEVMIKLYKAVLDQIPLVATDVSCISWLHDFMEVLPSPKLSQVLYADFDQRGKPLMALVAFSHTHLTTNDPDLIQKVHGWITSTWQQEVDILSNVQVDLQQLPCALDRLIESLDWARQVWLWSLVGVDGVVDVRAQGMQLWMPAWMRVVSRLFSAIGQMPPDTDWRNLKNFMIEARYYQQAMLASLLERSTQRIYIDRWIIVLDACVRYVASHPPLVDILMNEGLYWNAYRQEFLMSL